MSDNPAVSIPQTGELRRIFETRMDRFAFTGDEKAWQEAQRASRMLTRIHRERQEQAEKEKAQ